MIRVFLLAILLLVFMPFQAQTITNANTTVKNTSEAKKPALVVGIVVDQMRYDYLTRFSDKYTDGGFRRLIREGFNCEDANFNYIPTYTAVGHTSIYTGTTPENHGIISNDWYDKYLKKSIYCVDDDTYYTIGAEKGGKKSPNRMAVTTITDEVHLAQGRKGKVIGISIKDRAAILPAGHTANAAYWFEGGNDGKFITSSFYMNQLPKWVVDFNNSGIAEKYMNTTWNTLYDVATYTESIEDDNPFEGTFKGMDRPMFPYNLKKIRKDNGNFELLKAIPFGNSILEDFAEAIVKGEELGKDAYTDFLAVSFSSTDYVGHRFGVDSKEIEDTYLRLDRDLSDFLTFLDTYVGKGNYLLFLTADHAAVQVPSYLQSLKIPAGYFDEDGFKEFLNTTAKSLYGTDAIIENVSNFQVFLNREKLDELHLDLNKVEQDLSDRIINFNGIYKVVTAHTLQSASFNDGILAALQQGYNQKLSGDILMVPYPATIDYSKTGSTHGSAYTYDTHVPLIFYGKGIKKGATGRYIPIPDIAATLANLLQVNYPSGCTGNVIWELKE